MLVGRRWGSSMRFAITALGSAGGRTLGQVVSDIVRYLEPRRPERPGPEQPAPTVPSGDGPSSYYADRGTEPGRWLGYSAAEAALTGPVDSTEFARVLAGRDPRTGARLLSASGSAGRRPSLGAGQQTRTGSCGEALYGVDDVAAALKVTKREAEVLISAGERHAVRALVGMLAPGVDVGIVDPEGSYLVPIVDENGYRWATAAELDRCEQARSLGISPDHLASGGQPTDQLSVAEAARLSGVTTRYIRHLCRAWENHREAIHAAQAGDKQVDRAYLVAHRGTRDQWVILRRELVAFLERRVAPAVRVGFDLTLTTEKSLGVLALLGDDQTRKHVLAAIEAGNDTGLDYLELHAAGARAKGKPVLVRGLTIASFRHLTSRALDPFPHHHNVIANSVIDEHGTRRALDARGLYTHAQGASALATIAMRHQLKDSIGVRWRRGRSGSWEIDGIGDDVLREFSQRRNEIEDAIAELEAEIGRRTSLDEVQAVITGTRPAKEHVDPATLVEGWWDRARCHGLTPETLRGCLRPDLPSRNVDEMGLFEQLASPSEGVCASHSLFTRSDVLVALADFDHYGQPLHVGAAQAERLADGFLASRHVVQLDSTGLHGTLARQEFYTTREILDVQRRILDRYQQGAGRGAVVTDEVLDARLAAHPTLTGEQQHLVRSFCTSGHAIQCAIGRAGAGKTTTMRAAADAWRAAGYEVIGAAVKGEAARHLAVGAGIGTETVAWYLARADQPPLHHRTVLVVDEASTLSDRDLGTLLHMAGRVSATVRLIGDPDQHGAVAAGGMFRHLCHTHSHATPELVTTHRVTDPADRDAARLLRAGRTHEALTRLAQAGHLHLADNDLDLYLGMLHHWWDGHQAGSPHPMVDRRHYTRRVLNRLARKLRQANDELGDIEIVATGERAFAVGDRIVARVAARDLHAPGNPAAYVRNGATGTITAVHPSVEPAREVIVVCFDDIGTIALPRTFFDEHDRPGGRRDVGIDHAYAVTSYAVQGATFDISTSRIDEGATRSEAYVDITRGREANHLYLTRAPDPLDGEHLPKAPDRHLHHTVADCLHHSGPERAAIELPVLHRPTAQARKLAHDPPHTWTARLPDMRGQPVFIRRHQMEALEAVLSYRSLWHPSPGMSGDWEWALGVPVADARAFRQRQGAITTLDALASAAATEQLARAGVVDPWAIEQVRRTMSLGVPTDRLGPLIDICAGLSRGSDIQSRGGADSDELARIGEALRDLPYSEWFASSTVRAPLSRHDSLSHGGPA